MHQDNNNTLLVPYRPSNFIGSIKDSPNDIGFELDDVNFDIKKGSLTMIFGEIGSGKSSLLYALMGEMNAHQEMLKRPDLKINGSMFYVSQKPWLLSMTVRENIILDKPYIKEKFDRAVKMAALDSDLAMFDNGAERLVSDGADNLSGGQRTRVALASSFYQE